MRIGPLAWISALVHRMSLPLRVGSLVVLAVLFIVGIYKGYQTYDYIEHDNDFCQGCHLMQDPFQRFSESGHKDLWCKSCHHPTLVDRSKMALTQVFKQPTEIMHHAHVPNEACAACHIEGDPERWAVISQTAGHRVHLESAKLEGLQCVKCHSVAIHDFVPVDRTCGQSDCHPDTKVQLGKMAMESELHCVACHDFMVAPEAGLKPRREECLGCHAMQERLGNFHVENDPHKGKCADCHNAHTQTTPAQAVESCLNAGCHGEMLSVAAVQPPMHRGLSDSELRDCLQCHAAHEWKVTQTQCADCHSSERLASQAYSQRFDHARHSKTACAECHDTQSSHGKLALDGVLDCMGCHHDPARPAAKCQTCHSKSEIEATRGVSVPMQISVDQLVRARELPFSHDTHTRLACARCHDASALAAGKTQNLSADCASCHDSHHTSGSDCSSCHPKDLKARHDRNAHVSCSSAGCHSQATAIEFASIGDACLVCHSDRREHEPGSNCRSCHFPNQLEGGSGMR